MTGERRGMRGWPRGGFTLRLAGETHMGCLTTKALNVIGHVLSDEHVVRKNMRCGATDEPKGDSSSDTSYLTGERVLVSKDIVSLKSRNKLLTSCCIHLAHFRWERQTIPPH